MKVYESMPGSCPFDHRGSEAEGGPCRRGTKGEKRLPEARSDRRFCFHRREERMSGVSPTIDTAMMTAAYTFTAGRR